MKHAKSFPRQGLPPTFQKALIQEKANSEATIKAHITAVFRKLGVRNRTQAVIAIQQMELDPSEQSLSGS